MAATYPAPRKGTLLRQYERVDDPSRIDPAQLARLQKQSEDYEYWVQHTDAVRAATKERFDVLGREFPQHQGTGLGFLNAVAEVSDHTRNRGENGGASVLGYRAAEKIRAFRYLNSLS